MSLNVSKKPMKRLKLTKKLSIQFANDPEGHPDFIPVEYIGTIESTSMFCRGWNPKRDKYCRQTPGHKTDHKGVGRCAWHGKGGKITHGRYAKHVGESLKKHLVAIQEEDGDRTDLTQEVDLFRAITAKFLEEYDEMVEALLAWNDAEHTEAVHQERRARPVRIPNVIDIGSLVKDAASLADKIHTQQHRDSIPKRDFFRLQEAMSDVVTKRLRGMMHIIGEDNIGILIQGISDDWSEIRL